MAGISDIAETFQMVEPEMRLELLLEYAGKLPPLPERYHALRDAGLHQVHECQAPVFLVAEVEGGGTTRVLADVPREAPTARAFCAILHEAFDGAPVEAVLSAPADALYQLGLTKLLGMQRTRGLSAIYRRLKSEVARKVEEGEREAK